MDRINNITGRDYKIFNYYGVPDATDVVVSMGSSCEVIKEAIDYLNAKGNKLGVVQVRLFRPFSAKHLCDVIPQSVQRITVLIEQRSRAHRENHYIWRYVMPYSARSADRLR